MRFLYCSLFFSRDVLATLMQIGVRQWQWEDPRMGMVPTITHGVATRRSVCHTLARQQSIHGQDMGIHPQGCHMVMGMATDAGGNCIKYEH